MNKKYAKGFYGGKFMPFHKGHTFCVDYAASLCDELHVILFTDSKEEEKLVQMIKGDFPFEILEPNCRAVVMKAYCENSEGVMFSVIDCDEIRKNPQEGNSEWDAETPYVLNITGRFDVVFSSEPSYGEYFARAYPWAEHVIIDEQRLNVPISGTQIREMNADDAFRWTDIERRDAIC